MNNDIETRLRSADPFDGPTPEQLERDRRWLRERITATAATLEPGPNHTPRRRRTVLAVAAAAAAALTGIGSTTVAGVFDSAEPQPTAEEPLELALAPDSPTMASCIPFSTENLAGMPVAFSGTVVEEDENRVLIQVHHWYRGGDTDQVNLLAPDVSMTSLDGMLDFEEGQRYLVTAGSGVVNYCGYTAIWNEQMASDYESAFDTK